MILLIIGALVVVWLVQELYFKRLKYPPGPMPLPIVGNILSIAFNEPGYEAYIKWKKQYGPIYTYWLGPIPVVTMTDYPSIKETIIKDADSYAYRFPISDMTEKFRGGEYGIIDGNGQLWRDQRRFALHTLRDFGMGKNLMEERVQAEIDFLLERLTNEQRITNMQGQFDIAVGSVINVVLFGYRFDEDRLEEFTYIKKHVTQQMTEFASPFIFLLFNYPFLRSVPGFKTIWERLFRTRDVLFDYFKKQIKLRESDIDFESEESSDFVESFLKERRKHLDDPEEGGFTYLQLENLVFDLWIAGMETTSNTLTWGIVYILNNPEVQKKIHEELDDVIKSDRKVTQADRNSLHYMNATVCEIQRLCNLLPQNLFRCPQEDVQAGEFTIPKGTCVVPQISCVLYDEKTFPDPYRFDPARFLNADGTFKKVDELIPFSIGKRQCLGEGLARLELFLFLSNIMQSFEVSCDEKPSMKKSFGTTVMAAPFECRVKERHA